MIDAVADWRTTDRLNEREKLVLEFTDALTDTPASCDDELRGRVRKEFSEKQMVELAHTAAWENARARFNRAFDIQPDGYVSD